MSGARCVLNKERETIYHHRPRAKSSSVPKSTVDTQILENTGICCNGQIVGQPRTRECRQSVWKLPKKCPKNVPKFPEGPKIKKNRDFDRDWKFRSRMKFSSEPPTAALFFVGKSRHRDNIFERDQKFRSRLKISIEIKFFWSLGPLGCPEGPKTQLDIFSYLVDAFVWWPCRLLARCKEHGIYHGLLEIGQN